MTVSRPGEDRQGGLSRSVLLPDPSCRGEVLHSLTLDRHRSHFGGADSDPVLGGGEAAKLAASRRSIRTAQQLGDQSLMLLETLRTALDIEVVVVPPSGASISGNA